jgi:hypothetical protein
LVNADTFVGLFITHVRATLVALVAVAAFPVILIHPVPADIFVGSILQVYIQVSVIFCNLFFTLLNQEVVSTLQSVIGSDRLSIA